MHKKGNKMLLAFLMVTFLLNVIPLPFDFHTVSAHPATSPVKGNTIAVGGRYSLELKSDGTVVGWGDTFLGGLNVPAGLIGVESISAGGYHSLALKSDGTVVGWGDNRDGQASVPAGLTGVVSISAGWMHSMALKSDGTVVAWGNNNNGETNVPAGLTGVVSIAGGPYWSLALKSDGTVVAWGINNYGQINVPAGLSGVVAISAGGRHALALKSDGTVVAWGDNHNGETNVPAGLSGVVSVAAGGGYSLALKSDGTVVAWGRNVLGQISVPAGLTGVIEIATNSEHSLALKADGTLVAWGRNLEGQTNVPAGLALPVKGKSISAGGLHSLVLKSNGTVTVWGSNTYGQKDVPAGLNGVVSVSGGYHHSLALKSNGTVSAWGLNDYGQSTVPGGLNGVVAIAAGFSHSLALKSDGTVVPWGDNALSQTTVPVGLNGVISIAAGGNHSLALRSGGAVVGWGDNASGQSTVPAAAQSGVVAIDAGYNHSLALNSDGTVVVWGDNALGQTTVPAGLNGVVAIAAGEYHSLALKSNGTVVAWGSDSNGQSTVPAAAQSGVVAISAGNHYSLALKADGTVVTWGDNSVGQVTVPGSDNLSSLSLQEGSSDQSFQPSVTDYTYSYIGASVSSVHVTAALADSNNAALYINNNLQTSGNEVTVNVTGSSTVIPVRVEPFLLPGKAYSITVLRDSSLPDVQLSVNGNAASSKTATTVVTVSDTESGVDPTSLQYAWTQSTTVPSGGWTAFTSGATLTHTSGDGSWYLHIRAKDQAGNVTDQVSNPFVLDNTAPSLILNGSNPMNVPQGRPHTEPGATATDAIDGNIPASSIAISGNVNTAIIGTYPVLYQVTDHLGNSASVTRNVYVYNGDAPAIYLNGPNPMTVEVNRAFTDPGATAQDLQDGDLSTSIMVTGSVDTSHIGSYHLDYNVKDHDNNAAQTVTRAVYVISPPVITLLGQPAIEISVGATFTDPGAQAVDGYYGDLSNGITITSVVNTQTEGTYTLRYNVQNPAGISAAEVTRTVKVVRQNLSTTPVPSDEDYISTDGNLTLAAGKAGWASFGNAVKVTIPAGATNKEMKITLKKFTNTQNLPANQDMMASPIFEIQKNLQDNFLKPVTISISFEPTSLKNKQTVGIFYYDEAKKVWVEVTGSKINGNQISVEVDHFTKFAVFTLVLDTTGHWAEGNIKQAVTSGMVSGYPDGTFKPDRTVTRAEFAVMLMNALKPQGEGAPLSFTDVGNIGAWAQKAISQAVQAGIISGYEDGSFRPEAEITRAEMAVMLARAMGQSSGTQSSTSFADDKVIPAWAKTGIAYLKQTGIVQGKDGNQYAPLDHATRAEAVTILLNMLTQKSK